MKARKKRKRWKRRQGARRELEEDKRKGKHVLRDGHAHRDSKHGEKGHLYSLLIHDGKRVEPWRSKRKLWVRCVLRQRSSLTLALRHLTPESRLYQERLCHSNSKYSKKQIYTEARHGTKWKWMQSPCNGRYILPDRDQNINMIRLTVVNEVVNVCGLIVSESTHRLSL